MLLYVCIHTFEFLVRCLVSQLLFSAHDFYKRYLSFRIVLFTCCRGSERLSCRVHKPKKAKLSDLSGFHYFITLKVSIF